MTAMDELIEIHRKMSFLDYLDLYCGDMFLASYWFNKWKESFI